MGGQPVADRELLLDAAERALRRDGSAVSLEAIAVEAGVTKPVIYSRIGDRSAVAAALAQRLADRLVIAGTAALDGRGLERDALAALIEATLRAIAADRELFVYVTSGGASDTLQGTLQLAGRSAGPLAQLLRTWLEGQGRDPNVAKPWSYGVIGMLNMVSLWWIHEPDRDADVLAGELADLLWPGLAGR